jgi:hypothetical protein
MIKIDNARDKDKLEKGQAIIILALVFIALIGFTGLVVDGGTFLLRYAQLRRATDAAAVQASNQFREFRPVNDMYNAAAQVFVTQGFEGNRLVISVCRSGSIQQFPSGSPIAPDPAVLAPQLCTTPPRKLVRADSSVDIGLPFLSILGFTTLEVKASATGEAAALDLVIVLDRSGSMSDESNPGNPAACAAGRTCQPFETVRSNAAALVRKLYFPYDQVAIIEFDRVSKIFDPSPGVYTFTTNVNLNSSLLIADQGTALTAIDSFFSIQVQSECQGITGIPTSILPCPNTNTGGAIRQATTVLAVQGRRRGSVWMMLLLTDGAPNLTDPLGSFTDGFCPPTTWRYTNAYTVSGYISSTLAQYPYANPFCRRVNPGDYNTISRVCLRPYGTEKCGPGVTITDTMGYKYDANDYARDMADYMGSNGIVTFVIGLGPSVSNAANQSSETGASREPNGGERLLRYVADVGSQPNSWECRSDYWTVPAPTERPTGQHCGNYWYAATGGGLQAVFDAIANRIFTRITQ